MNLQQGRHVLVVEDDHKICQDVQQALEQQGYTVSIAERGRQAIDLISQQLPDLAIIDLYLPDMNGFEVCRTLKRYADIPIIILTHEALEDMRVQALDQYAEDYIIKPYSSRELVARVGRILRRFHGTAEDDHAEIILDDRLRVNFTQHWIELRREERVDVPFKRLYLTPIESRILYMLVSNAPRVMTREALLARVWSGEEDAFPEGLRVHIRRLRIKVEPDAARPTYIVTERGLGYRLGVALRGQPASDEQE